MPVFKAPQEALQAHLEAEDVGIWAGKGRIVAESPAATVIYLDERFRHDLVKIGNPKILRGTYKRPDIQASLVGPDVAEIAGPNYRFHLRTREDEQHLVDIRIAQEKYQPLSPLLYPQFAAEVERAAAIFVRKGSHRVYFGGPRLYRKIASITDGGDVSYVARIPESITNGVSFPLVNVPLLRLIKDPTSWLVSDTDTLVADKHSGVFLQASHFDEKIPCKITDVISGFSSPIPTATCPAADFLQAVRVQLAIGPEHFTIYADGDSLVFRSIGAEIPVAAQLHGEDAFAEISFQGKYLQVLEEIFSDPEQETITMGKFSHFPIAASFSLGNRMLIMAGLRR